MMSKWEPIGLDTGFLRRVNEDESAVTEDELREMWDEGRIRCKRNCRMYDERRGPGHQAIERRTGYCWGIEDERKRAAKECAEARQEILDHWSGVSADAREEGAREERERVVAWLRERGLPVSAERGLPVSAERVEAGAHLPPPPDKRKEAEERIIERMAKAALDEDGHEAEWDGYVREARAAWLSLPESARTAAIDEELKNEDLKKVRK